MARKFRVMFGKILKYSEIWVQKVKSFENYSPLSVINYAGWSIPPKNPAHVDDKITY